MRRVPVGGAREEGEGECRAYEMWSTISTDKGSSLSIAAASSRLSAKASLPPY